MRGLLLGALLIVLGTQVMAQGRGSGGGGMRQGQGQQKGYGQGMGMGQGSASQPGVQTKQQDRYRECTQATSRLRKTLRKMSRGQSGVVLGADQARRYRRQLREQWQLLLQERSDWLSSLSEEQAAEVQPEIASSEGEVQKLKDLVDLMDLELGEESVNADKVREDAAKAEAATQRVEQEQQKLEEKVQSPGKGQ